MIHNDMFKLRIPYDFFWPRVKMNWTELLVGLKSEFADGLAPIAAAHERLSRGEYSDELVELAYLDRRFEVAAKLDARALVERLASQETCDCSDTAEHKWLYLVLAWLYEHKDDYADPLIEVAIIYAVFGYPKDMRGLIYYEASGEPIVGDTAQARARLIGKWRGYLNDRSKYYRAELIANKDG